MPIPRWLTGPKQASWNAEAVRKFFLPRRRKPTFSKADGTKDDPIEISPSQASSAGRSSTLVGVSADETKILSTEKQKSESCEVSVSSENPNQEVEMTDGTSQGANEPNSPAETEFYGPVDAGEIVEEQEREFEELRQSQLLEEERTFMATDEEMTTRCMRPTKYGEYECDPDDLCTCSPGIALIQRRRNYYSPWHWMEFTDIGEFEEADEASRREIELGISPSFERRLAQAEEDEIAAAGVHN